LFSRLDDKKRGVIINVQQRLHEDDLSGHLLRAGGWLHLNLAAIAEQDEWVQLGPGRDRYFRAAGEPMDPEREPLSVLDQIRRTWAPRSSRRSTSRPPHRRTATLSS
jgi:hypothetical protein